MKCTQSRHLDKVHEDIDKLFYLDEVHEDIAETLHVVPSALLDAKVGVDRGVPSCPSQVLVFSAKCFGIRTRLNFFAFCWPDNCVCISIYHLTMKTDNFIPVWYVLVCPCIPIFFGKPEVDDIHKVSLFAQTPGHKKVKV